MKRPVLFRSLLSPSPLALAAGLLVGLAASRRRPWSLAGKNALVTGGSRGLGLEIARVLVRKGAGVAVVARDGAEIERALADLRGIRAQNGNGEARPPVTAERIIGVPCDLRDPAAIDAMLAAVRARLGPIDVVVNDAGTIQVGPLDAMTFDDFEEAMRVHCFAPLRIVLGVRDEMRARGGGRIANIASVGGLVAVPHLLPYSASKFALVGLSQGLRAELARDRILVSTIAPGLMRTGSPRQATFKGDREKEYAWFATADSIPFLSMSSERAARRIVHAIEHGEPHVVLGLPAQVAALAGGLAPGLVAEAMALANTWLPESADTRGARGYETESPAVPSFFNALRGAAAARNNEG